MALFGGKKRSDQLEAENEYLREALERAGALDGVTLAWEAAALEARIQQAHAELDRVNAEADGARKEIVEIREIALLQEAGIYAYRHPLADAVAYQSALEEVKKLTRKWTSSGQAVTATTAWSVNGSEKAGMAMVRDFSKLMLRAYNSEADNAVRSLKPFALASAKDRLDKVRETIARLGKTMSIQVASGYHDVRIYELELTADYLVRKEAEKEALRAERELQREEEKAQKEIQAERTRLAKEQAHYRNALEKLTANGDTAGAAEMQGKLNEIDEAITGIDYRVANTRAGFVYIISNIGAFGEGIVKIGMTRRLEPMDRIRELGDASVPFRFDVHALIFSKDAVDLESRLHAEFAPVQVNQVNTQREFFYVTPAQVLTALERFGGESLLEYTEMPEAVEWHGSGGADRRRALTLSMTEESPRDIRLDDLVSLAGAGVAQDFASAVVDIDVAPGNEASVPASVDAPVSVEPQVAAGWFTDPHGKAALRYWDGTAWTENVSG